MGQESLGLGVGVQEDRGMNRQSVVRAKKKKARYNKRYYRDHQETLDKKNSIYAREHVDHSFPRPEEKLTEVPCIGERCWREGKTFMSPDPARVRMCPECEMHAGNVAGREARELVLVGGSRL